MFRGRSFYVKRDDTIDPLLSGNKYRKLYSLIQTPASQYSKVLSYGGVQSNAMLSIAALCHLKGWEFHYTAKQLPTFVKADMSGNLKMALDLGMQLHEVDPGEYTAAISRLSSERRGRDTLLIPQGGADPLAEEGIRLLADEIVQWQTKREGKTLSVVTPSGTGTTAFYLAHHLPKHTIVTTPIIGNADYLHDQLDILGDYPDNLKILENSRKFHFGKPYQALLDIYEELRASGLEIDLLYGAKMWWVLMDTISSIEGDVLYVHSGGLIGNETMLPRYEHKGFKVSF